MEYDYSEANLTILMDDHCTKLIYAGNEAGLLMNSWAVESGFDFFAAMFELLIYLSFEVFLDNLNNIL